MTMEVPTEIVEANDLPRERGIDYNEVVRIIGSLYLDSQHALVVMEERHNSIIQELRKMMEELQQKNQFLEEQLRKINEQRFGNQPDTSGQNQD